jgi:hypothetical protein
MVGPRLITRTDYRVFEIPMTSLTTPTYFEKYYKVQSTAIEKYLNARPDLEYKELRQAYHSGIERRIFQFKRLDDSKMFALALSEYIDTQGYRYE